MIKRVVWIVLDSVGIGALPDAERFGDKGCNTLCNTINATHVELKNMERLGIGHIEGVFGLNQVKNPIGNFGRCIELSEGKDTTVGHWEMAGVHSPKPLPTYPNGFPKEIMDEFERLTGCKTLVNLPYSGTKVLDDYGKLHMETGALIVYTSADSVFQIASHEDIVPLEELYRYCEIARNILQGEHAVARVIARPFNGVEGAFKRTSNRHDYSLSPPNTTVLDLVKKAGLEVISIGKIEDIFNGQGITKAIHTKNNMEGIDITIKTLSEETEGIIFTNLVEFDSTWGHRNDVVGYANGLLAFDTKLPEILASLKETDVLIMNADHGCDPTTEGTDHTREYIPLLVYGKQLQQGVNLGTRQSFADIGQTIAALLGVEALSEGNSFLDCIVK